MIHVAAAVITFMNSNSESPLDDFTQTLSLKNRDTGMIRSHQVAGAGARCLAGLVDLGSQMVTFGAMAWLAVTFRPDLFPRSSWGWAFPVAFAEWHIIYLMLFESFTRGASPGKALLGLRVISLDGSPPSSRSLIVRNVTRVVEIALGVYTFAYYRINQMGSRQRLGDRSAGTIVVYAAPLTEQLYLSETPESLYSTSEDGYLLQAWVEREQRFDEESRMASAIDLAAYLHAKYDASTRDLPDPATYLKNLYDAEKQHPGTQAPELGI